MNIYLTSRLSRQLELRGHAAALEARRHKVISSWLYVDLSDKEEVKKDVGRQVQLAIDNVRDMDACNAMIHFGETPETRGSRDGRLVELGYGMGRGMLVCVVGPIETTFSRHPRVRCYPVWADCLQFFELIQPCH